jgi:hypothetical protein
MQLLVRRLRRVARSGLSQTPAKKSVSTERIADLGLSAYVFVDKHTARLAHPS